ncbi:MAG: alpha/beta fold hydrolase [Bdellovibrionaceae bacterium]|nr:alpha/beta fold hydrolase [Bdellovibrionales bacterium]MCB9086024.1 alpha/beta fold hydrolase [Pseudobdellovibrionaceae bacterium]
MIKFLFILPGLALHPLEFAYLKSARILENPGFYSPHSPEEFNSLPEKYSLEDVAEIQARIVSSSVKLNSKITLVGFSMGGMILSIMATKYRHLLPKNTKFVFVNTSPNLKSNPVLTPEILSQRKLSSESLPEFFSRTLQPFFSDRFIAEGQRYTEYVDYRANPDVIMPVAEYVKQVEAILAFDGESYYKKLNPSEVRFVFSEADKLIHQGHIDDTKRLVPGAEIEIVKGAGHMIHVEKPDVFKKKATQKRRSRLGSLCSRLFSR